MGGIARIEPKYPLRSPALRAHAAKNDTCPECAGALDTGWECNDCGYDARDLAYPPHQRALDKRFPE